MNENAARIMQTVVEQTLANALRNGVDAALALEVMITLCRELSEELEDHMELGAEITDALCLAESLAEADDEAMATPTLDTPLKTAAWLLRGVSGMREDEELARVQVRCDGVLFTLYKEFDEHSGEVVACYRYSMDDFADLKCGNEKNIEKHFLQSLQIVTEVEAALTEQGMSKDGDFVLQ